MNKRYGWLADVPELRLGETHSIVKTCLQPQVAPMEMCVITTEEDDQEMFDAVQVDVPKLKKEIASKQTFAEAAKNLKKTRKELSPEKKGATATAIDE